MKAKDLWLKTMKFVWLRLGCGMLAVLGAIIGFAIPFSIGLLFDSAVVFFAIIGIALGSTVYGFIMHYVKYLIKAAHVAVIATAVDSGTIPDNMFSVGKDMVKERFVSASVYFGIDRLISGSVRQIQNAVGAIGDLLGNIPGLGFLVSLAKIFIGIMLNYIDECCLGLTFIRKGEKAFKCACDGVCIYFKNVKTLLKSALKVLVVVVGGTFAIWLVSFLILGLICKLISIPSIIAAVIAIFVAAAMKAAFIDSYMMIKMMTTYTEAAKVTTLNIDIYEKLCGMSNKFKSLFNKANSEAEVTM